MYYSYRLQSWSFERQHESASEHPSGRPSLAGRAGTSEVQARVDGA